MFEEEYVVALKEIIGECVVIINYSRLCYNDHRA